MQIVHLWNFFLIKKFFKQFNLIKKIKNVKTMYQTV